MQEQKYMKKQGELIPDSLYKSVEKNKIAIARIRIHDFFISSVKNKKSSPYDQYFHKTLR